MIEDKYRYITPAQLKAGTVFYIIKQIKWEDLYMTKEAFKKKIKEHNVETIYTSDSFSEGGYRTFNESETWPDDDKSYGVYYDDEKKKWVA